MVQTMMSEVELKSNFVNFQRLTKSAFIVSIICLQSVNELSIGWLGDEEGGGEQGEEGFSIRKSP